jgi:hypothetical protein
MKGTAIIMRVSTVANSKFKNYKKLFTTPRVLEMLNPPKRNSDRNILRIREAKCFCTAGFCTENVAAPLVTEGPLCLCWLRRREVPVCPKFISQRLMPHRDSAIRRRFRSLRPRFQRLLHGAKCDNAHATGAQDFSLLFHEARVF